MYPLTESYECKRLTNIDYISKGVDTEILCSALPPTRTRIALLDYGMILQVLEEKLNRNFRCHGFILSQDCTVRSISWSVLPNRVILTRPAQNRSSIRSTASVNMVSTYSPVRRLQCHDLQISDYMVRQLSTSELTSHRYRN